MYILLNSIYNLELALYLFFLLFFKVMCYECRKIMIFDNRHNNFQAQQKIGCRFSHQKDLGKRIRLEM